MPLRVASHKYYYLLTSSVRKLLHQHNAKAWRHCCLVTGWNRKEAEPLPMLASRWGTMMKWPSVDMMRLSRLRSLKLLQSWRCHCGGTFHSCQRRMILLIISSERETRHYHVRKGVSLRQNIWAYTTVLWPSLCRRNTFNYQLITALPGVVFHSCSVFVLHHIPSTQVHILKHFTL